MDSITVKNRNIEVGLESGLLLTEDDSKKVFFPSGTKLGKTLFAKVFGGIVGDSIKGDAVSSLFHNESSFSEVFGDLMKVTSTSLMGKDSRNRAQQTPMKEKWKNTSNKKALKPRRSPQAFSLDVADLKLFRDMFEPAMLKRARIERMKALKKMKISKSSSRSSSSFSISNNKLSLERLCYFLSESKREKEMGLRRVQRSKGERRKCRLLFHVTTQLTLFLQN
ncbi:hypothetical protein LR48_Vigan205s006000 [Vigna angularis]|uniref:Uncharacterized protein n=1 Tax=Phaseolus angularis TaxID=3914 RepID=A0A0L9T5R3_PHAAN|nr:hypothetical protein LR48_Vigan205s006000 [Vigna angularis]